MGFAKIKTQYDHFRERWRGRKKDRPSRDEFYARLMRNCQEPGEPINRWKVTATADKAWHFAGRPYYHCYPAIAKMLRDIRWQDVPVDSISMPQGIPSLALTFQDGSRFWPDDVVPANFRPCKWIIFGRIPASTGPVHDSNLGDEWHVSDHWDYNHPDSGIYCCFDTGYTMQQLYADGMMADWQDDEWMSLPEEVRDEQGACDLAGEFVLMPRDNRLSVSYEQTPFDFDIAPDETITGMANAIASICVGACLLADDPEYVLPLAASELTFAQMDAYAKRGEQPPVKRNAWTLGKDLEMIPHYRRPHLAMMACGPRHSQRRMVMRRGSLVHRKSITELPTGFDKEV